MKTLKYYDDRGFSQLYIFPSDKNSIKKIFNSCEIVSIKVPQIFLKQKILKSYHLFNKSRFLYFSFIYTFKIKRIVKNFNPNLIYAHLQYMPLTAYFLFQRKKPIFVRYYGLVDTYKYIANGGFYRFEENLIPFRMNFSGYILVNDGTAGDLVALKRGVKKEKILFLMNGVDDYPILTEKEKGDLKNSLNIRKDKPIFLFLNRITKLKGITFFIDFLKNFKERDNVTFLVIGDGEEREVLLEFLNSKKIDYRYIRYVPQDQTYRYYQISDLFLSFNILSSLNNPVLESIKNNTPVLSLKRGFNIDFLNDYIFCYDDVEKMVEVAKNYLHLLKNNDEKELILIKERLKEFKKNYIKSWDERMEKELYFIKERLKNV
ncbi:MAG: glycosyltransferase family 4 protein [bacterium]|nr:glycosyltransferase family 4 protein [bacterium]